MVLSKPDRIQVSERTENREKTLDYTDLGAVIGPSGPQNGNRRRQSSEKQSGRNHGIPAIKIDQAEMQHFAGALTKHAKPGKQALLALRLAQGTAKDGLTSTQVAELLQEHFAVTAKESAIRMALVRGASKDPVLVAAQKTPGGTVYRLTRQGLRHSDSLLN
jgi:hypothetical protein